MSQRQTRTYDATPEGAQGHSARAHRLKARAPELRCISGMDHPHHTGAKKQSETQIADPGAMMAEHPKMYRWTQPVIMALGVWLATNPLVFEYADRGMVWSDVLTGLAIIVIALVALREKYAWVTYLNALTGMWLILAPLFFWAPNAATYASDTLIGVVLITLSFVLPMSMPMPGPDVPPGWSYNPSTWIQRAPIIALGLIGFFLTRPMAGFQLGYVDHVWEPFFSGMRGNGTETVLGSEVSKSWPISDAGLGAATYIIEVLSTFMGDQRRWRTMPWMVAIFGLAVIPLGVTSIVLVMMQPMVVGAWCALCLAAAFAMLLMVPLALDEVIAMIQFLHHARQAGHSALRAFLRGGTLSDAAETPRADRSPAWKVPPMLWGVTNSWTLWLSTAVGIWLMATPAIFGMVAQSASADNCHLVGALIVTVSIISMAEAGRAGRWVNALLALWLLGASWTMAGASGLAHWNVAFVGALLIPLSFPLGRIRDSYGTYDPWVLWAPLRLKRAVSRRQIARGGVRQGRHAH